MHLITNLNNSRLVLKLPLPNPLNPLISEALQYEPPPQKKKKKKKKKLESVVHMIDNFDFMFQISSKDNTELTPIMSAIDNVLDAG